jgi:hypothetical protein
VLALASYSAHSWLGRHQKAAQLRKADQLDVSQASHEAKAVIHEQEAQALKSIRTTDDDQVAQARAEVARFERAPAPRPDLPAVPDPEPVGPPVDVAGREAAKDRLIEALSKDLEDTQAALHAQELADQERLAQVRDLQGEVLQLRSIIAARPTARTWSVGAVYGTNRTVGGYVTKDLGLVQVGMDVVRRELAPGQTTLEAIGHLGLRF